MVKWVWVMMMIGIGVEFATGVAALAVVPVDRPDGWFPTGGEVAYLIHAGLGAVLMLVTLSLVLVVPEQGIVRVGVFIGLAGLALGAVGGSLTAYHPSRFVGLLLMLVGTLVAFFGYLIPLAEPEPRVETE